MYYDEPPDCPGCGVRDEGWNESDVRQTLFVKNCLCKNKCACDDLKEGEECPCQEECLCDQIKIQVRINRIWDKECGYCGGADWRPEWQVLKGGKIVATVPSESAAHAVIETEFPNAKADYDPAWESERWLRRAEGN